MAPCSTFKKEGFSETSTGVSKERSGEILRLRAKAEDVSQNDQQGSSRCIPSKSSDYVRYMEKHPSAKLIGIDGKWYEISSFIAHHPGGDIIANFIGKDASSVFHGFHERDVLKYRNPVGIYQRRLDAPASLAFAQLFRSLREEGFFKTDRLWFAGKIALTFFLLMVCVLLVTLCSSQWCYWVAAVFLAGFWQQCGFLMHDCMHNHVFHSRRIDQWMGTFFGTVCFGVNATWWRDEHFIHHALTNTVNYETKFVDKQMHENVWAQNVKLLPFNNTCLHRLAIRIQHITFIPICVLCGRVAIIIDSFVNERRRREWLAFACHVTWISLLLYQFPSWKDAAIFYAIAAIIQGVLHIQLLISHYAKSVFDEDEICNDLEWYRMQIDCNINIANPAWMDWFHGGLNFHIEHHLFPTMPRHNYRAAGLRIKRLCKELEIVYDECTWSQAVYRTLVNLKQMSRHFSMDPR